jgi:hypothetical protein
MDRMIRSAQENVIDRGDAREGCAFVTVDGMKHLIGEHEAAVEHHSATAIEMRMQDAGPEAVAHGQDEHCPFVVFQVLATDDRFCVGDKVSMAHHDKTRYVGGAGSSHQGREIVFLSRERVGLDPHASPMGDRG